MEDTRTYEPSEPRQVDCLIAPNGDFYAVEYRHHSEAAMAIAQKGVYDLEDEAWLHISNGLCWHIDSKDELTPAQVRVLTLMIASDPTTLRAGYLRELLGLPRTLSGVA